MELLILFQKKTDKTPIDFFHEALNNVKPAPNKPFQNDFILGKDGIIILPKRPLNLNLGIIRLLSISGSIK